MPWPQQVKLQKSGESSETENKRCAGKISRFCVYPGAGTIFEAAGGHAFILMLENDKTIFYGRAREELNDVYLSKIGDDVEFLCDAKYPRVVSSSFVNRTFRADAGLAESSPAKP